MFLDVYKTEISDIFVLADDNKIKQISYIKPNYEIKPNYLTKQAINELDNYFNKKSKEFNLPLDLNSLTDFQNKVLNNLAKVKYSKIITYKQLANSVNNPKASRAIGNTMAINPFVIVIPCHRVLLNNHKIGNYTGGVNIKQYLLDLENADYTL